MGPLMVNKVIIALIFAVMALSAVMIAGGDAPHLKDRTLFTGLSRGDVLFPHDRHYAWGIGCLSCHHSYEDGVYVLEIGELYRGGIDVSCKSCHVTGRKLEKVYHRMCIECHEDFSRKGIESGPVMCGRSHVKRGE